jgi:hypothetical protein
MATGATVVSEDVMGLLTTAVKVNVFHYKSGMALGIPGG